MATPVLYALQSQSSLSSLGTNVEIKSLTGGCEAELEAIQKSSEAALEGLLLACVATFIGKGFDVANKQCKVELWQLGTEADRTLEQLVVTCDPSYPFLLMDCSQPEAVRRTMTAKDAKALQGLTGWAGSEIFISLQEHDPPLAYTFTYHNITRWFE